MDEQILKIWNECKKLEGMVLKNENVNGNMNFVNNAKDEAEKYEWLYHCTTSEVLLSIISNNEFWLKNLKLVNDAEEVKRIDVPEYEEISGAHRERKTDPAGVFQQCIA